MPISRLLVLAMLLLTAVHASAQETLPVNFDDPEIQAWRGQQQHAFAFPQPAQIPELNLPVLNFVRPPFPTVRFSSANAALPIMSVPGDDRDSYAILNRFGSFQVTVFGSRRVQTRLDAAQARLPPQTEVEVQTSREDPENPREAFVNFNRFGLPYTLMVECDEETRAICSSAQSLRELTGNLGLIYVPKSS
jgi:hypothetical protein